MRVFNYALPQSLTARLLLVVATSSASAQTFDRDIRIDDGPPNTRQAAPQVRVAPNGTVYLSWTDYRASADGQVYLASSTDGGATYTAGRPLTNNKGVQAGMQRGAQFVVDAFNNLHFVWQELNTLGKISARYAKSTDGGATFSNAIAVGADEGRYNHDFPTVAVDSSGNVYLAWIDDREHASTGHTHLYFVRSLDGGLTFQQPVRAGTMPDNGGSCECCNTSIAVSPAGNVYISFRSNISNKRDTWIARSFDRGSTFTVHQAASENWVINACPMTGSSIALDRNETAHVVWRDSRPSAGGKDFIYYTTLKKDETTCAPDKRISNSPRRSNYPSLAIRENGMLFCAFQDNRNDANDIYYVKSVDGGATFSADRKLTHETGTSRQELASVAIAPNGAVFVAWQDFQRDEGDVILGIGVQTPPADASDDRADDARSIEFHPQTLDAHGTELRYRVSRSQNIRLSLVDVLGNEVLVLADGFAERGEHRASVDISSVPSGIYTLVARTRVEQSTARVMVRR